MLRQTLTIIFFLTNTAALAGAKSDQGPVHSASTNVPAISSTARKSLVEAVEKFNAAGGAAIVMNAKTGAVLAAETVNKDRGSKRDRIFDNVYEMGGVARLLTIAMGLQEKKIDEATRVDVSKPFNIGAFTISDYRTEKDELSIDEAVINGSNIAAAKISMMVDPQFRLNFQKKLLLTGSIEKSAKPIITQPIEGYRQAAVGFGHGIAMTPLHAVAIVASLNNRDGLLIEPYVEGMEPKKAEHVVRPDVSKQIQRFMRANTEKGTGTLGPVYEVLDA